MCVRDILMLTAARKGDGKSPYTLLTALERRNPGLHAKLWTSLKAATRSSGFRGRQDAEWTRGISRCAERMLEVVARRGLDVDETVEKLLEEAGRFDGGARTTSEAFDATLASPGTVLLGGHGFPAGFVADVDGLYHACETAAKLRETGVLGSKNRCERIARRSYTCFPDDAVSIDTVQQTAFVPTTHTDRFRKWMETTRRDATREEWIDRLFRPPSQGGVSMANVIGTGFCGGVPIDRRKKKRVGGRDRHGIRKRPRSRVTPTATSSEDVPQARQDGSTPRVVDDTPTMPPAYLEEGDSAWLYGCPILAKSDGRVDPDRVTFTRMDGDDGEIKVEEAKKLLDANERSDRTSESATMWRSPTGREREDIDAGLVATWATARSPWIDAARIKRVGTSMAHDSIPCGCFAEIVATAVVSARRALAKAEDDVGDGGNRRRRRHLDEWILTAFLVDAACGTVSTQMATSRRFAETVAEHVQTMLIATRLLARGIRKIAGETVGTESDDPDLRSWAIAMSAAKRQAAESAALDTGPRVSKRYFSRVRRTAWIHEAVDAALAHGLVSRAEEVAVFACRRTRTTVTTKKLDEGGSAGMRLRGYASFVDRRGKRLVNSGEGGGGCGDTLPSADDGRCIAALFDDDAMVGWACDVAWTASVASSTVGGSDTSETCGHLVPLTGKTSVLAFGDDGGGGAEGRPSRWDAFVLGAMRSLLEDAVGCRVLDCTALYPFVFVVFAAASGMRRDGKLPAWMCELERSAAAWLCDRCTGTSECHERAILDAGFPTGAADDPGRDAPRLAFELLRLAFRCNGGEDLSSIAVGLSCVLRPKRLWMLSKRCMASLELPVVAVAEDAIVVDGGADSYLDRWPRVDRWTRTRWNVSMAGDVVSGGDPRAAATFLCGLRLSPTDSDEPPTVGKLFSYESLASYLTSIDRAGAKRWWHRVSDGDGCCSSQATAGHDDGSPPSLAALARVCGTWQDIDGGEKSVLDFLSRLEYPSGDTTSVADIVACCDAKDRRVPLCQVRCTGKLLGSDEYVPLLEHPFSLDGPTPVTCCGGGGEGCTRRRRELHRDGPKSLQFLPPKDGPLMAELVHARHGMMVFPYAFPEENVTSLGVQTTTSFVESGAHYVGDYPVKVLREIVNMARRTSIVEKGGVDNDSRFSSGTGETWRSLQTNGGRTFDDVFLEGEVDVDAVIISSATATKKDGGIRGVSDRELRAFEAEMASNRRLSEMSYGLALGSGAATTIANLSTTRTDEGPQQATENTMEWVPDSQPSWTNDISGDVANNLRDIVRRRSGS